jgi:hypothetical protein
VPRRHSRQALSHSFQALRHLHQTKGHLRQALGHLRQVQRQGACCPILEASSALSPKAPITLTLEAPGTSSPEAPLAPAWSTTDSFLIYDRRIFMPVQLNLRDRVVTLAYSASQEGIKRILLCLRTNFYIPGD